MTKKIYKSAMGKTVDLGALLLQNEQVRAVGNMNVNARGDMLDSSNRVTEQKNRQVQRKYNKQTNVTAGPVATSTKSAKQQTKQVGIVDTKDTFSDLPEDDFEDLEQALDSATPVAVAPAPQATQENKSEPKLLRGGLAAAIARIREIKQELDKPLRQRHLTSGVKKI
jgi:hypothetical protein